MISYSNKVKLSNCFKKDIKKVLRQGRNIDDLLFVVSKLANKSRLDDNILNQIDFWFISIVMKIYYCS